MFYSPKDVVKNKELTKQRYIPKPSIPTLSSTASDTVVEAAAAASVEKPPPSPLIKDEDTPIFIPPPQRSGEMSGCLPVFGEFSSSTAAKRGSDPRPFRNIGGAAKRKARRPTRLDVHAAKPFLDLEAVEVAEGEEEEEASEYDIDDDDFTRDKDERVGRIVGGRGHWARETESARRKRRWQDEEEDDDDYDNIAGLIDDQPIPATQDQDAARAKMIEESKQDYFRTAPDSSGVNQALRASISAILKKQHGQENVAGGSTQNPPPRDLEAAIEQARHQIAPKTDSCEALPGSPDIYDADEIFISSDSDTAEELKRQFLHAPSQELTK